MLNPTPNTNRLLSWMSAKATEAALPEAEKKNKLKEKAKVDKKETPFGKDVLAFVRRDLDQDGFLSSKEYGKKRQDEFKRYDYDTDGKLSELELAVGRASDEIARLEAELRGQAPTAPEPVAPVEPEAPLEPTEPEAPVEPAEPELPPAFGYTLKNSHPVSSLATQFDVSTDDLMAANGWTNPNQQIPAGTVINVPDTPAARQNAAAYGGRVSEPVAPQAPAAPRTDGSIGVPGDPNDFHMTQFVHERFNNSPNAPWGSANCGPTSLAMALKATGLQPPGLTNPGDTEHWIDTTREAMGAMWDNAGHYGDSAYTNIGQVKAGAEASGATWEDVNFSTLDAALAAGKPVVAAGNPAAYNGDWMERGISNSEYNGGHFITITGKDADGNYLINDPLSNVGSVAITPDEMSAYMGHFGNGAAVAISNPNAPAPSAPAAPTEPEPVDDIPMTDTPAATGDTAKLLGAMTAEDIENVLTQRGSVLAGQGYGDHIINMERKYGVPAAQFLAQAVMESSLGNAGYTQPGFNIGNLRPGSSWTGPTVNGGSGEFRVYGSWEEGIEDYFKLLADDFYAGRDLADQIWDYCPPWDGNDTNHYYGQIVALINQWTGIQM